MTLMLMVRLIRVVVMTASAVPTVADCRARLRDVANEIRAQIDGRSYPCARTREWALMPENVRMSVLLLSGIDGDLQTLAKRQFSEFTSAEKISVQVAIRSIFAALSNGYALRQRAA